MEIMRKKLALLLSLVLLVGATLQADAAEEVGVLVGCTISIGILSDGLGIACCSFTTKEADEIGVKDVVLQEKVNGVWRDIKFADGGEKNADDYVASTTYKNAVKGRTYRAHCTHYAVFGSTTKTLYNYTDELVYN